MNAAAPVSAGATGDRFCSDAESYSAAQTGVKSRLGVAAAPFRPEQQAERGPNAFALARLGLSLIPISPGTKRPLVRWKGLQSHGTTEQAVRHWSAQFPRCNWACLWGRPSGLIAVDVDSIDALQHAEALGGFGENPIHFKAQKPGQWVYRVPSELLDAGWFKPYPGLEIRCSRSYSVVPPSVHPSGCAYQWVRAPESIESIPYAPAWVQELIQQRLSGNRCTTAEKAAAAPRPATSTNESPDGREILSTTNRALLDGYALGFIAHHSFPGPTADKSGCRNQAALCYAMLLKGAGVRIETAIARLNDWATRQRPVYGLESDECPEVIVRAVYSRPYRLSARKLLELEDVDGERMTRGAAEHAARFYPPYRGVDSWTKQPALDAVCRALEVLAQEKTMRPRSMSLDTLARKAGISARRVEEIAGFLDEIGVRTSVDRVGRSSISTFNLSAFVNHLLSIQGYEPRLTRFCLRFVEWRRYKGQFDASLRWLRRRLGALLQKIIALLSAVLDCVPETSWCGPGQITPDVVGRPELRAPPAPAGQHPALERLLATDLAAVSNTALA